MHVIVGASPPLAGTLAYCASMNSYFRSPRLPCEVRGCFFQEGVLHLQLTVTAFQLPQPRPLRKLQRRLITGMLLAVRPHPAAKAGLIDSQVPAPHPRSAA